MGAAGRHRQVALGGTQPPEMPPNLSQPLGMPPKPRRNARALDGRRARTKPLWSAQIPRPACAPGAPRDGGTARHFPRRPAPKPRWVKDTALESCCLAESLESLIFIQNIDHLTTGKSKSSNRSRGNCSPGSMAKRCFISL